MRKALASSWIAMIAIAITVNVPPVCLTSVEECFNLTHAAGGFLLSSVLLGFLFTLALAGPAADRIGMRPLLVVAPIMQIAGLLTSAFAPTYRVLVAGAFLMGSGNGILEALVNPIVCLTAPENKTRAVNFLHSFYAIGAAASVLGTSFLLRAGGDWRHAYLVGAAVPAIYGVMYALSDLPTLPAAHEDRTGTMHMLRRPVFILLICCMFLAGGAELGPAQWIPAYMEDEYGLSKFGGALVFALFSAAMMCGRLTMSRLSESVRPLSFLKVACVSCAAMVALSALLRGSVPAAVVFFFFGFFVSVFWPTLLAVSTDAFPRAGATMYSILGISGNAGGVFPWVVGAVADRWSLRAAIGVHAILPLALLGLLVMVGRQTGRRDG
ncbi:MAG TPA: MFS transporter [Candidatus Brocadiia bacterium]|nr:MFS transporter [Candidatus Brocadiia bacterium]